MYSHLQQNYPQCLEY